MADEQFFGGNGSNLPGERDLYFKFFMDAANPPTSPVPLTGESGSPLNKFIVSMVRVSQGIFRITFRDSYLYHVATFAELHVAGTGLQRWAQPGPTANFGTSTPATVDILIVDNANAVQDPPAAEATNFLSGCITVGDVKNV